MSLKDYNRRLTEAPDDQGWSDRYDEALDVVRNAALRDAGFQWWHKDFGRYDVIAREAWLARMAALRAGEEAPDPYAAMHARFDLDLLLTDPVPRPDVLPLPFLSSPGGDAGWEAFWRAAPTEIDGRIVLGEKTVRRDYRSTQTVRRSIWARNFGEDDHPESDLDAPTTVARYGRGEVMLSRTSLWTVGNPFFPAVGIGRGWLALHPQLARFFDLTPSANRPLAWCDALGALAVETVYWCDGPVQLEFVSDAAEGWLVLGTPEIARRFAQGRSLWEWAEIQEEGESANPLRVGKRFFGLAP